MGEEKKIRKKTIETTATKYNGLPYWAAIRRKNNSGRI